MTPCVGQGNAENKQGVCTQLRDCVCTWETKYCEKGSALNPKGVGQKKKKPTQLLLMCTVLTLISEASGVVHADAVNLVPLYFQRGQSMNILHSHSNAFLMSSSTAHTHLCFTKLTTAPIYFHPLH